MSMDSGTGAVSADSSRGYRHRPVLLAALTAAVVAGTAGFLLGSGQPDEGAGPAQPPQSPAAQTSASPVSPPAPEGRPIALDAGDGHSCVLTAAGVVLCWGRNGEGQVGTGSVSADIRRPTQVIETAAGNGSISAGVTGSCVVTAAGGVRCWGIREDASNGAGIADVPKLTSGVIAVSVGARHQCALTGSGKILCWGDNDLGQLGDGTRKGRATPTAVAKLPGPVMAVAAGVTHTCALTRAGGVVCWGRNAEGQLGNGGRKDATTPVAVKGLTSGVRAISAGDSHTCAITDQGRIACWGSGGEGQLGNRTTMSSRVPVTVVGLARGAVAVSAGSGHTCAITPTGGVACWGANDDGELGDGSTAGSAIPVDVAGLAQASAIAAGSNHTCAATVAGVSCWGINQSGQLGNGTRADSLTPQPVAAAHTPPRIRDTRPLNIIYLDTDLALTAGDPETKVRQGLARRLRSRDPILADAVRQGFIGASGGRQVPSRARIRPAKGALRLPLRCVDDLTEVDKAARRLRERGAINVVVVKAPSCDSPGDGQTWAGIDLPETMPVAYWSALNSVYSLTHVVLHEVGHDAGLGHAGIATCENPVKIAHCTVQDTDDGSSLMSYAWVVDTFTGPELEALHLLDAKEIVRVRPGQELPLRVRLNATPDSGPTLLILERALGKKPVYLSWYEGELQLRYRIDFDAGYPDLARVWGNAIRRTRVFQNATLAVDFVGTDTDGSALVDITFRSSGTRTPSPTPSLTPTPKQATP